MVYDTIKTKTIWITGKGGVGKSVLSGLLTNLYANDDCKCLYLERCDIPAGPDLFNCYSSHEPVMVQNNIYTSNANNSDCLQLLFNSALRSVTLARIMLTSKIVQRFFSAAPGALDFSFLYRVYSLAKLNKYDYIFVDLSSFGHAFSQFKAVRLGQKLFKAGPISRLVNEVSDWFSDEEICEIAFVTLPEELPVLETISFYSKFKKLNLKIQNLFINQIIWPDIVIESDKVKSVILNKGKEENIIESIWGIRNQKVSLSSKMKLILKEKLPLDFHLIPFFASDMDENILEGLSRLNDVKSFSNIFTSEYVHG